MRNFGHRYIKYLLNYAADPEGKLLSPKEWAIDHAKGRFEPAENDFNFQNRPQPNQPSGPKFGGFNEKPPSPKFGSYFNKDSFLLRQS